MKRLEELLTPEEIEELNELLQDDMDQYIPPYDDEIERVLRILRPIHN